MWNPEPILVVSSFEDQSAAGSDENEFRSAVATTCTANVVYVPFDGLPEETPESFPDNVEGLLDGGSIEALVISLAPDYEEECALIDVTPVGVAFISCVSLTEPDSSFVIYVFDGAQPTVYVIVGGVVFVFLYRKCLDEPEESIRRLFIVGLSHTSHLRGERYVNSRYASQ